MTQKTSKTQTLLVVFAFFGLTSGTAFGQSTSYISLSQYLESLEETYEVRFSYDAQLMEETFIPSPQTPNSLSEGLQFIPQVTIFDFEIIDTRYIALTPKYDEYISGFIRNRDSLKPIQFATIRGPDNIATVSNAYGFFLLPKKENGSYIITHIGFEPIEFNYKRSTNKVRELFLIPSIATLDEVVVSTYFTSGISKQKFGSFRVNTQQFGLLPGQVDNDVLQIIQVLPGIDSADETISNINIRGGTQDENLVLWNGIKMYQNGHFFGLISAFNPELTQRVDVYKNGTPPRYGESVSGVISMNSKNTRADSIKGSVGFNLINGSAFAEFPLSNKLGIQVAGRSSANSSIKTPVYKTYSKRIFQDSEITNVETSETGAAVNTEEEFNFYDISTRVLWDISKKSTFRLNLLGMDNRLDFTENIEGTDQSKRSGLDQRSLAGGIEWEHQLSSKVEMTLSAYVTYYLLKALNRDIFTTQELLQENEILETGAKLEASYLLNSNIKLQTGYHFSELGIANTQDVNLPRFRNYEKEVLRTHVGFLNSVISVNTTQLQLGVRYNYFGKFEKGLLEPRISIYQPFGNGFSAELLGELKSQTSTQRIDFQSDFLGIEKRRWVLADEEETPIIQSKQTSLAFQFKKNKWFVSAEGFYKWVEGITTANQGFQNQFQFIKSTGSYQVYGSEFVVNHRSRSLSVWLSYLYLKNQYDFDNLLPSSFPNNLDIRNSVNLAASYTYERFQVAFGFKWHSGKPYTQPVVGGEISTLDGVEEIVFQDPNSSRLPDYFRADLSAKYLLELSPKLDAQINVALLNVLNTQNTLNIRYFLDADPEGNTRLNEIAETSLGFTPNVSFQLLF